MVHNIIDSDKFEPKETMLCNWCHYWEDCSAKETTNPARKA